MQVSPEFINEVSAIIAQIKPMSEVDLDIPRVNIDLASYQGAFQVTQQYSQFLINQKTRFNLAADLNSTDTFKALNEKKIQVFAKIREAKEIAKAEGFVVSIEGPRIVGLSDDINVLRKNLIHRAPRQAITNSVDFQLIQLDSKLTQLHDFLAKHLSK